MRKFIPKFFPPISGEMDMGNSDTFNILCIKS